MLAMCLWGAGLAGFVPMTPLVPMMAPDKKGAANSAVNFGSGLGNFVGPALVSVLAGFGTGVGDVYYGGALFIQRHPGAVS
ncbi:permease [Salmonella enterica subsp. enterica]|nr:permease [Salmonella enterica subsp. enterica]